MILLKTYNVVIKTLGPVHIGEGRTLKKHEYIYEYYKGVVHYVDGSKLVTYLKHKNLLNEYLDFIRKTPKVDSRKVQLKNFWIT